MFGELASTPLISGALVVPRGDPDSWKGGVGKEAQRLVPKCMWGSLGFILCPLRDRY